MPSIKVYIPVADYRRLEAIVGDPAQWVRERIRTELRRLGPSDELRSADNKVIAARDNLAVIRVEETAMVVDNHGEALAKLPADISAAEAAQELSDLAATTLETRAYDQATEALGTLIAATSTPATGEASAEGNEAGGVPSAPRTAEERRQQRRHRRTPRPEPTMCRFAYKHHLYHAGKPCPNCGFPKGENE